MSQLGLQIVAAVALTAAYVSLIEILFGRGHREWQRRTAPLVGADVDQFVAVARQWERDGTYSWFARREIVVGVCLVGATVSAAYLAISLKWWGGLFVVCLALAVQLAVRLRTILSHSNAGEPRGR